jgi:predicted transcriptional regulator with HTH domain
MASPPLPEGARLALLHWPWGTPSAQEIVQAAGAGITGRIAATRAVVVPLIKAGLIERMSERREGYTVFRLTQAGRRAVDAIQSGEAGQ